MRIPLRAISAFYAAARSGSISRAAQDLGVTPSAVSQQIHFLESYLGTSLLAKSGRGIALTEAGGRYFELIADQLDGIEDATQRLRGYSSVQVLTVRVAPTTATKWLLPFLQEFLDAHPSLEVRIDATNEPTDFLREGVDVEIRHGEGRWQGLFVEPLTEENVVPLCSPRLAAPGSLQAADLVNFRLIHSVKTLVQWGPWLRMAGVEPDLRWKRVLFDRSHMSIDAAAAGMGIALESNLTTWRERRDGLLICPIASPPRCTIVSQWIVCPHDNLRRGKVRSFIDWVKACVERQAEGSRTPSRFTG
ncbi:LysR substrate-binding domain-containing protein [Chelatococcus sp. GCM10030263]|uniref:LysR substrate-binding domain-containing protein n=1 Tax=Chelatococcus sp. GCM10030263 TaxID=3273387 RepID=UPI0036190C1E